MVNSSTTDLSYLHPLTRPKLWPFSIGDHHSTLRYYVTCFQYGISFSRWLGVNSNEGHALLYAPNVDYSKCCPCYDYSGYVKKQCINQVLKYITFIRYDPNDHYD